MKRWLILAAVALIVVALAILRYLHLDSLLWYRWQLNDQSMPAQALDFSRYRVDIEGRVIQGLEDDVSALTFNAESGTLWALLNGEPLLVELDLEGRLLRRVAVEGVVDMEGLTHVSGHRYVIAEERSQRLLLVEVPPGVERLDVSAAASVTIGMDVNHNKGFEGLSWDGRNGRLLVVKERDPLRVLSVRGFVEAEQGAPMALSIDELKPPGSPRLMMRDLSSLTLHDDSGHLLLLSDESHMLVEYAADGRPLSLLGLWGGMSGLRQTVPQAEGVALDDQRRLYLVSEPNLFYRFTPDE